MIYICKINIWDGVKMGFSYKPLWKLLIERDMNKEDLRLQLGISTATMAKMGKDENISFEVLNKICTHFGVQPSDIIEHKVGEQ
jgi:DNA-binding Xre family transcriptional regulator